MKKINWLLIGCIAGILAGGGWLAWAAISQQVGINVQTTAGAWVPVIGTSNSSDAVATSNVNQNTDAFNYGFNGATWDRLRSSLAADSNAATGLLDIAQLNFNGATWDRTRSASTTNLTTSPLSGVTLTLPASNVSCTSTPAAGSQATCSLAAGAGTVRHVATTITACASDSAAATVMTINLRDGASGAGTIKWSGLISLLAGTSQCIPLSGLSIPGSATTAMTLEFAAAGAGTTTQSVTLTALNVQ